MFQIPVFLKDTYHTTSMPCNSKKCLWHTRAMVSHFTSGIDKRTGTGSVRNALGTLASWKST